MTAPEADAGVPPRRWRFRMPVRLRTLMVLVLIFALGLAGWLEYQRRAPIRRLLAALPAGILLSIGPSWPHHDPTHPMMSGVLRNEVRQIRANRVERVAVDELVEALRFARAARDEKSIRSTLAALQWIGPEAKRAVPELLVILNGTDNYQVRSLAAHDLGIVGDADERVIPGLIAALNTDDETGQKVVSCTAANELGGLGPKAKAAVPTLTQMLEPGRYEGPGHEMFRASLVRALGNIGPDARPALPTLVARLKDNDPFVRGGAAGVLGRIYLAEPPQNRTTLTPVQYEQAAERVRKDLVEVLTPLLDDKDPFVQIQARQTLQWFEWAAEVSRRLERTRQIIAADRALGGRPRPKFSAKADDDH